MRFVTDVRDTEPPLPRNYFPDTAADIAQAYLAEALAAKSAGSEIPAFPDAELEALVFNTWGDTGRILLNNWLGLVYQLTGLDRP